MIQDKLLKKPISKNRLFDLFELKKDSKKTIILISKKANKLAVSRNKAKRIIFEFFRNAGCKNKYLLKIKCNFFEERDKIFSDIIKTIKQ